MKKILVLGSNGMLGHLLMEYFKDKKNYEIFGLIEEQFSFIKHDYEAEINKIMPDIIINALRMVVHDSENHPKRALYINSHIPKHLEKIYFDSHVKIIHLSTDCIFSGNKGGYLENDPPDSTSVYSMSKFCGEIINEKDLTIRTSYIGPCLMNKNEELFDWFIQQNGEVDGYKNAFWNGVTTLELSKQIEIIIKENICGLYHLCSKKKISKYNLLMLIKEQWNKNNVHINKHSFNNIDRSLVDNRKELNVPKYDKMFNELFSFMNINNNLYEHYSQ